MAMKGFYFVCLYLILGYWPRGVGLYKMSVQGAFQVSLCDKSLVLLSSLVCAFLAVSPMNIVPHSLHFILYLTTYLLHISPSSPCPHTMHIFSFPHFFCLNRSDFCNGPVPGISTNIATSSYLYLLYNPQVPLNLLRSLPTIRDVKCN